MSHPDFPNAPWIGAKLRISKTLLAEVEAHALATYPSECCGFLMGDADDEAGVALVDEACPLENQADKYHSMDPETFPRTSRTYFKINELKASRAVDEGAAAGRPVKVLYHSHCDAGPYFSKEDAATFSQGKRLMWPFLFLVVSVQDGKIAGSKVWSHVAGSDEFEEVELLS